MKSFTVQNTWSVHGDHGWGNGYVAIPPTSSWHGVDYSQVPVRAHGSLTWSSLASTIRERGVEVPSWVDDNEWVVGFDTVRSSSSDMDEYDVRNETYRLLGALEQLDNIPYQKDVITQVRCPHCSSLNNVSHLVEEYNYGLKEPRLLCCDDCGKPFYFSI